MKKKVKKLVLAKETVRNLDRSQLEKAAGAIDPSAAHRCKPDTFYHCSTNC